MPDRSRTVHAVLSNNCSTLRWSDKTYTVHTVSTKTTHSWNLAGKKSDVTKAKLKTSPVVTKQLHSRARVSPQIVTIIDVSGTEVQVPSLSSPGYSVWILISRGQERFVNEIHRHNSDIMNYSSLLRAKEDDLNDVCFESSKPVVLLPQERSKNMPQKLTMDTGHSWGPEKQVV